MPSTGAIAPRNHSKAITEISSETSFTAFVPLEYVFDRFRNRELHFAGWGGFRLKVPGTLHRKSVQAWKA